MQDIYCQETDKLLLTTKETYYGITLVQKKYHLYMFLKTKDAIKESQYSTKIKYILLIHPKRTYFWDTAVPCGSENSHNVVPLNPDEDKNYLFRTYPTLMQPLKNFSPESIRTIARNPNIDLQSIGIYSKSVIQRHIRSEFQELLAKMDTKQRQSIDQNLRKLAETAGFSDIYA